MNARPSSPIAPVSKLARAMASYSDSTLKQWYPLFLIFEETRYVRAQTQHYVVGLSLVILFNWYLRAQPYDYGYNLSVNDLWLDHSSSI